MIRNIKKKFEILPKAIKKNKVLKNDRHYVADGEVVISSGVCLRAADAAIIYLVNGPYKNSRLKRSALIFKPGSQLNANKLTVKAANRSYRPENKADNGGIWFLGTGSKAKKDGIELSNNRKIRPSLYKIQQLNTSHLGKRDVYSSGSSRKYLDDIDGISILGLSQDEWNVKKVSSLHAGDDGIDITNSHINLDSLVIKNPTEDCINLSSSRLVIHKNLTLLSPKNGVKDRDLFDFETDEGASFLELHRGIKIEIEGVFGDQVILSSNQMPPPVTKTDNESTYKFKGKLNSSALIFTIDKD